MKFLLALILASNIFIGEIDIYLDVPAQPYTICSFLVVRKDAPELTTAQLIDLLLVEAKKVKADAIIALKIDRETAKATAIKWQTPCGVKDN